MKHVKKSLLLWHSPAQMYALVTDCSRYPDFLPWCAKAETLEHHDQGATVRLHLAYAGLSHHFTTENRHVPDREVHMRLVDGPFSHLEGTWRFHALEGDFSGLGGAGACKVEFDLEYHFANATLQTVVSPVFDKVASTLVDRFVARADQVYGAG